MVHCMFNTTSEESANNELTRGRNEATVEVVGQQWLRQFPEEELECPSEGVVVPLGIKDVHFCRICTTWQCMYNIMTFIYGILSISVEHSASVVRVVFVLCNREITCTYIVCSGCMLPWVYSVSERERDRERQRERLKTERLTFIKCLLQAVDFREWGRYPVYPLTLNTCSNA